MDNFERRAFADCRAEASDNGRRIMGHAIVFNAPSLDLGGFKEIIAPEAVDRTLTQALDVHAFFNHDSGVVLGRTRAGTLSMRKDTRGLLVEISPDMEDQQIQNIMRKVQRGEITGMSFGFRVLEDDWDYDGKTPVRTVLDMSISEVSVVAKPAYPQTTAEVAMRSLAAFRESRGGKSISFLQKWHKTQLAK